MKVENDGEYAFRVTTDASSKAALSVSGQGIFNDIVAPSGQAAAAAAASDAVGGYAADAGADGRDVSASPSGTATTAAAAAAAAAASAAAFPETMPEGRTGSLQLQAGQLIPLQLRYVVSN